MNKFFLNIKRLIAVLMLILSIPAFINAQIRVFTIGDSTVQDYNDGYAPRKGWGQMLPFFFDKSKVVCYNKAVGGTSSKSFYNEKWADIRKQLKAGDFVFIQFGINDRATQAYRYAPKDTFNAYIKKYVNDCKAKGAFPVLVSTVRRAAWQNGKPYDSYHEHPQLMRDLATSLKLPLVDLDKFCYDLFVKQGQLYSERHITMHLEAGEYSNYPKGNTDQVHYQETGAIDNARCVIETIEKSTDANLKKLIPGILPRYNVTFKINDASKAKTISRSASFPAGINVTLKTIPQSGAKFLRWEDGTGKSIATTSLKVIKMGSADITYKAVYQSNIVEKDDFDENAEITIDNTKKVLVAPKANKYVWYFNNAKITNGTTQEIAVSNNGTYSVELFDASGKLLKRLDVCVSIGKDGVVRKIYLIGDSTVCDYKDNQFPMTGWGQVLKYFFNSNIQIVNHAIGGRSSRSFREQGRWKTVLNALKPGDFVFIQFGHNDRDTKPERYTPVDKYKLYIDSFVVEARGKGAIPVLVSPMVLNAWKNGAMRNVFTESGADYRGAMETVAKNRKCAFVDLNMKSYNYFKQFDSDYLSRYFYNFYPAGEYSNYPSGSSDGTHFQEMGAMAMCRFITEGLREIEDPYICSLQSYLKPLYKVTVKANKDKIGTITQSNTFPEGCPVSVKVLPSTGNKFLSWNRDGKDVAKTNIYRFTMVAKNTTLTAMFDGGSALESPLPSSFPADKKRIAYITDPNGATYADDPIQPMLKAQNDLFVWEISSANSDVNLEDFDMVLISEETPSTAPIIAELEGINKPVLNMKVHAYKTAAGAWGWATKDFGDNTTEASIYVESEYRNHQMFSDITFTTGEIQMVSEVKDKALTFMNPASFTDKSGLITDIASVKGEESQICIFEIAEGATIGGVTLTDRFIQIGLNSSSYANLTEDALSVIRNACYYLMGVEKGPETASKTISASSENVVLSPIPARDFLNISCESENNDIVKVSVVDAMGRTIRVATMEIAPGYNHETVDLTGIESGIYMLKLDGTHMNGRYKIVIKD
ncbi:MAG: GDSL-type esterase/lipase family protein [Paludibacteraceae bacterium]|nr:GDSL-type esterase/lipase family protein [Paludibacteraceae bacterium]